MKTHLTFVLLTVLVSLVGCKTVDRVEKSDREIIQPSYVEIMQYVKETDIKSVKGE